MSLKFELSSIAFVFVLAAAGIATAASTVPIVDSQSEMDALLRQTTELAELGSQYGRKNIPNIETNIGKIIASTGSDAEKLDRLRGESESLYEIGLHLESIEMSIQRTIDRIRETGVATGAENNPFQHEINYAQDKLEVIQRAKVEHARVQQMLSTLRQQLQASSTPGDHLQSLGPTVIVQGVNMAAGLQIAETGGGGPGWDRSSSSSSQSPPPGGGNDDKNGPDGSGPEDQNDQQSEDAPDPGPGGDPDPDTENQEADLSCVPPIIFNILDQQIFFLDDVTDSFSLTLLSDLVTRVVLINDLGQLSVHTFNDGQELANFVVNVVTTSLPVHCNF